MTMSLSVEGSPEPFFLDILTRCISDFFIFLTCAEVANNALPLCGHYINSQSTHWIRQQVEFPEGQQHFDHFPGVLLETYTERSSVIVFKTLRTHNNEDDFKYTHTHVLMWNNSSHNSMLLFL